MNIAKKIDLFILFSAFEEVTPRCSKSQFVIFLKRSLTFFLFISTDKCVGTLFIHGFYENQLKVDRLTNREIYTQM